MTEDKLLTFKGTTRGVSKAKDGSVIGDRFQYAMSQEEVRILHEELGKLLGNEAGAKLDIHTRKKTNSITGVPFDSSFGFVKPIGERPAAAGFRPKAVSSGAGSTAQSVIKAATLKG